MEFGTQTHPAVGVTKHSFLQNKKKVITLLAACHKTLTFSRKGASYSFLALKVLLPLQQLVHSPQRKGVKTVEIQH